MRFILIRHGQTEWNLQRKIQGWCNSELTKNAITELKKINLPKLHSPIIYSSDLGRASQTASIVSDVVGATFTLDFRLRERKFGVLEGKVINEDHSLNDQWLAYQNRYTKKIGNGFGFESEAEFEQRILSFIALLKKHSKNSDIVIISHGEWIRAFINIIDGIPSWYRGRGVEENGAFVMIEREKN